MQAAQRDTDMQMGLAHHNYLHRVPSLLARLVIPLSYDSARALPIIGRTWFIIYLLMIVSMYGLSINMAMSGPQATLDLVTEMFYQSTLFGLVFGTLMVCIRVLTIHDKKICVVMRRKLLLIEIDEDSAIHLASRVWLAFF